METAACHVCGKPTAFEAAHARLTLRGQSFLVCCPMCLSALEAGSVQRHLMPASHAGRVADVTVRYLPALHVGGDFAVAEQRAGARLALAVGDVSGHGVTSALVSSRLVSEVERRLGTTEDLGEVAADLNGLLFGLFGNARTYATLFLARADPGAGHMEYVSCGQPPPLLWREGCRRSQALTNRHFPVGLFDPEAFGRPSVGRVLIGPGDRLLAYSDGLADLLSAGDNGDRDGLADFLRAASGRSGAGEAEAYERLAERHRGGAADDVLYLLVRFRDGSPSPDAGPGAARLGTQDPECGMTVSIDTPHRAVRDGRLVLFCSADCLEAFRRREERK